MAGVKGKCGGARPGAGRPKGSKNRPKGAVAPAIDTPATLVASGSQPATTPDEPAELDSIAYLRTVINQRNIKEELKVRAAIALAQYEHQKIADGGVKPSRQKAADKAAGGRFAPSAPPKLTRVV